MSTAEKNKAAVEVVRAMASDDGRWERGDLYAYSHTHGGSRATFAALAQAQERGWVEHLPARLDAPEGWKLTDLGIRRANRA